MDEGQDETVDAAALRWFTAMRDDEAGDADREAFLAWLLADSAHARAYDELALLFEGMDGLDPVAGAPPVPEVVQRSPLRPVPLIPVEPDDDRPEAGRKGRAMPFRVGVAQGWRPSGRRRAVRRGVAAASLAACGLLALGVAAPAGGMAAWLADARTGTGEVRGLTLPDGTKVVLDSGSALSWDVTSSERRVTLVGGRAYFAIADEAARPFVVETPNAEIRDIGTAFEVGLGDSRTEVAVAEGIVAVTLDDGGSETLRAGEAVRFAARFEPRRAIAAAEVAPWRSGRLIFEDRPLGDVLADLERHGAGRLVVLDDGIAARRLTGAFDAGAPDAALDAVLRLAKARATKVGPVTFIRAR